MNKYIGYYLKLHTINDKPIIDRLKEQENKQGYIKGLIKKDLYINNQYKGETNVQCNHNNTEG